MTTSVRPPLRVLSLLAVAILWCCEAPAGWTADPGDHLVSRYAGTDARCVARTPALTPPDSLGPIVPGMTVADLEEACGELERAWLSLEGQPQPVLLTRLGEVPVLVEVEDTLPESRIRRVSTASPGARTPDGIGPGVSLSEVLDAWPDLGIALGEGTYALSPSHPGISLELTWPDAGDAPLFSRAQRSGDLSGLPKETEVAGVLLTRW